MANYLKKIKRLPVNETFFQEKRAKYFPFWELIISLPKTKKVRVLAKKTLREFWERHSNSMSSLTAWFYTVSKAEWSSPDKLKTDFPSADFLADNRVVFNIKGNHYRLIAKINNACQMVWIRFVGTHAEYDKVNAKTI